MKIFIDSEFKCHVANSDGNYREVETDFFDGKCDEFIEGFCYDDSNSYEEIYPWRDHNELQIVQLNYELSDAENALTILYGGRYL